MGTTYLLRTDQARQEILIWRWRLNYSERVAIISTH